MISKIGVINVRRVGNKLILQSSKKPGVMTKSKMSLPAGKDLKTNVVDQPKRNTVSASSKCSDYEAVDYCTPLFP